MESEPEITRSSLPAHLEARVEAIIRAAEDHAQSIQRDIQTQQRVAESEAQRHVLAARREAGALTDDRLRRLRELTDELTERAEATLRQFEAFAEALDRATHQLEREGLGDVGDGAALHPGRSPSRLRVDLGSELARASAVRGRDPLPAAPEAGPAAAPADAPPRRTGRAAAKAAARVAELDAARLVAIEMAVDGCNRKEVQDHLRTQFSIEGIDTLLDDVFGEARGSIRPRWRDQN
jgi:hypothetical protein